MTDKPVKLTPSEAFILMHGKLQEFIEVTNNNITLWKHLKNFTVIGITWIIFLQTLVILLLLFPK